MARGDHAEKLLRQLDIPADSRDPTLPYDNYFRLLGIDECTRDANLPELVEKCYRERMSSPLLRRAWNTPDPAFHIPANHIMELLKEARQVLSATDSLTEHRSQLWDRRLKELCREADALRHAGVQQASAQQILRTRAAEFGFRPVEISRAAESVMDSSGEWPTSGINEVTASSEATSEMGISDAECHRPPIPSDGDEGFLFVSYKREDMPRITPHLHRIASWGYNLWYDRGIPGGAEWDAIIEDRVSHCILLLTFLSSAAVESKWVRREIKFADSLCKPILAVRLEPVELQHGLSILLSQYQVIDASADDFSDELKKAIEYVRLL